MILAVVLLGIALGSLAAAAVLARWPATLRGFAWTCGLAALGLAAPFALGDRIPTWTMLSQPLGQFSFPMQVMQWSGIAALVVMPASLFAGVQFPVLIALLGRGRSSLGAHTGTAYAWNTFGAIVGSLAGGFGLLPLLTAPGAWRLAVLLIAALSLGFVWLAGRQQPARGRISWAALSALVAVTLLTARGPTAVWRHNPIGAGRAKSYEASCNDYERLCRERRGKLVWEADGRESSIGLLSDDGYAFLVNGKADGHSTEDAATQVMSGLVGALLHEEPREVCVIGLGTGSTAGWLAQVPSIRRVDVVELEPAIRRVAQDCAPVNQRVLENPKVRLIYNDARDVLLTTRARYDLIFSEPSNPYRAGVASLFTREFYEAVEQRLAPGGIFLQWIQAYEIDGASVSTICATLAAVFPSVEIWQTQPGDLLLQAGRQPPRHDLARYRQRIGEAPFKEALSLIWYVNDVEGLFAHFVANGAMARSALMTGAAINTDDRNLLEFALARSVGRETGFSIDRLRNLARSHGWAQPNVVGEAMDELAVLDRLATEYATAEVTIRHMDRGLPLAFQDRVQAKNAFAKGDLKTASELWRRQPAPPSDPYELYLVALTLAAVGDDRAPSAIERLRVWRPVDAEAVEIHWLWHRGRLMEALPRLETLLVRWREYPWTSEQLIRSTLKLIQRTQFASHRLPEAIRLYQSLAEPFAVRVEDDERVSTCLHVARQIEPDSYGERTRQVIEHLEPHFPWQRDWLQLRADCYTQLRHPLAARAQADWDEFLANEPRQFDDLGSGGLPRVSARETTRRTP